MCRPRQGLAVMVAPQSGLEGLKALVGCLQQHTVIMYANIHII